MTKPHTPPPPPPPPVVPVPPAGIMALVAALPVNLLNLGAR